MTRDEQLNIKAAWHCPQCRRDGEREVRALLASRALEEAKWWDFRLRREASATTETMQRIAALEQAAAGGGQ